MNNLMPYLKDTRIQFRVLSGDAIQGSPVVAISINASRTDAINAIKEIKGISIYGENGIFVLPVVNLPYVFVLLPINFFLFILIC